MRKKEIKLSLFIDDRIYYIKNPREAKCNVLKLRYFGKVAEFKIFIQKVIFISTHNNQLEIMVKKKPIQNIKNSKA